MAGVIVLTGRVDRTDTLRSVGRRGRAGPVEEGGPSERCAFGSFAWCAGSGVYRACTKRARAGTGGELIAGTGGELVAGTRGELGRMGDRSSGRHLTSDRLTPTGSTFTRGRLSASTSPLGW